MSKPAPNCNSATTLVGLVPACGKGKRIAPLPCSKEIFPIGFGKLPSKNNPRPKVVSHYLLENMQTAGVKEVFIIIAPGKWDIPDYYKCGRLANLNLAYIVKEKSPGVPFTVNQAYPFIKGKTILFGFPDIIFSPGNAFQNMIAHQKKTKAPIVLGLFPAKHPEKVDMVKIGRNNEISKIVIKPQNSQLAFTWLNAVWNNEFTEFINEYLSKFKYWENESRRPNELYMGDLIQKAIDHKLMVEKVVFNDGAYVDIGTHQEMTEAIRNVIG